MRWCARRLLLVYWLGLNREADLRKIAPEMNWLLIASGIHRQQVFMPSTYYLICSV